MANIYLNTGTWDVFNGAAAEYTHPSSDGNLHVPSNSTTNRDKFLQAGVSAGSLSWVYCDTFTTQVRPLSNDSVMSTTTIYDIPDWKFQVISGKSYLIKFLALYRTIASTTGIKMGVYLANSGAGTIHGYMEGSVVNTAAASELKVPIRAIGASNTTGSTITTTGATLASNCYIGGVMVFNCTADGTFRFQQGSEVATSVGQINKNSMMQVTLLN